MKMTSPEVTCVVLHRAPQHAEQAAILVAKQWQHNEAEIPRYIEIMTNESKDTLPCHLGLILTRQEPMSSKSAKNKTLARYLEIMNVGESMVVGHVKLTRAAGRSDGGCCISYSLVVDEKFRGCGFGKLLAEEGENFARDLGLSYMYLSTDDKVSFDIEVCIGNSY